MSSFEAYEANLEARRAELRGGDPAYELHGDAIMETLPYDSVGAPETDTPRILDVGCGLGFLALKLSEWPRSQVVGIDPSAKAIALAQEEHGVVPNLRFHAVSAQDFPARMAELGEEPFDRAILNMVLHSEDDVTCKGILAGARAALVPHGALTLVVPDEYWLIKKLVEEAQGKGIDKDTATTWVASMLNRQPVDLAWSIRGQPAYEGTITVYNRTLGAYGELLAHSGFGLGVHVVDQDTREEKRVVTVPFWEWNDHTMSWRMVNRDRHVLMSQAR
jgi:SAM-dependent methyltransferase